MHSAVDYTCYEGMAVKGEIELVMQRGHVIVKENQFLGKKGQHRDLTRFRLKINLLENGFRSQPQADLLGPKHNAPAAGTG